MGAGGTSEELRGPHEAGGHARGGAPHPRGHLVPSLGWGPSPSGGVPSKNNFSHCKKDQSSRPNQTDNSKKLAKITDMSPTYL